MINETWSSFLRLLSSPPSRAKHLNGAPDSQALIDQPLMRRVVNELAVPDPHALPPKPAAAWSVVDGGSAPHYADGAGCALPTAAACAAVHEARGRTAFLAQLVRARPFGGADGGGGDGSLKDERIALAPDWLFGRGCLTHVRHPRALLRAALPSTPHDSQRSHCAAGPVPPAPGASGGILVATHFVYSMALKRKRAFRAFGWDLGDARNRSEDGPQGCWARSEHAMLFGHTFFAQSEHKMVLCVMPRGDEPACSCCQSLPSLVPLEAAMAATAPGGDAASARLESPAHRAVRTSGHFAAMEGCNDYQRFWDR